MPGTAAFPRYLEEVIFLMQPGSSCLLYRLQGLCFSVSIISLIEKTESGCFRDQYRFYPTAKPKYTEIATDSDYVCIYS
jgi:hypothetical protein